MFPFRIVTASLIVIATAVSPSAHDLRRLGDHSMQVSDQVDGQLLRNLAAQQIDDEARSVYARLLLWKPGQALVGCFVDGTGDEKSYVADIAKEMIATTKINLKVDFGTAPTYRNCPDTPRRGDMRVSFSEGCCSAYVGQNAHFPDPSVQNGPSIFLEGIMGQPAKDRRQTVIHEIFHSWGLEHEHQSPSSNCEEQFKKDDILRDFGWNEQDYVTNLKRLNKDKHAFKWTTYDSKSIMKYYLDPKYLKSGTSSVCYSASNYEPSETDIKGLQDAYPASLPVAADVSRAIFWERLVERTRQIRWVSSRQKFGEWRNKNHKLSG